MLVGKNSVVIVDEDQEFASHYVRFAEFLGFCAIAVHSIKALDFSSVTNEALFLLSDNAGKRDDLAFNEIRALRPQSKIVCYAFKTDVHNVLSAVRSGVFDYIQLPDTNGRLTSCINRALLNVDTSPIGKMDRQLLQTVRRDISSSFLALDEVNDLTKREAQVINLVSLGHSAKEIARKLKISPRTVEVHRRTATSRLKARNSNEAVAKFVRLVINNEVQVTQTLG